MVKGPPLSLLHWSVVGRAPPDGYLDGSFGITPWGKEAQARGSRFSRIPERLRRLCQRGSMYHVPRSPPGASDGASSVPCSPLPRPGGPPPPTKPSPVPPPPS